MFVEIYNKHLHMILDSAADLSTINESWLKANLPSVKILPAKHKLHDYNEGNVNIVGKISVPVTYSGNMRNVDIHVVDGNKPCLFGKDMITKFDIDLYKALRVTCSQAKVLDSQSSVHDYKVKTLLDKYANLFQPGNEPIKQYKAAVRLKRDAYPVFCKARNVPYSMKNEVEREILLAKEKGVWDFVKHSKWATPLVLVPKQGGKVRLCGDFKVTVNRFLDVDQYPLPTQQDLFSTLGGGVLFTKLDLASAYQQIALEEESQEALTITTHLGLVRPTRLLYGVANAAAVFQSVIDRILNGLKNVIKYQDDILVTGSSVEDHMSSLEAVLERLLEYGVKLNEQKCQFFQPKVEYLGHVIDSEGVHPTDDKIKAIKQVKQPENVEQLRSFLGLINYYIKFVKNSSTILHPLHNLLKKDQPWHWTRECEDSFQKSKNVLSSDSVLIHYDPEKPLKLECDASPYGLGAILSHTLPGGDDHPVAYASRTLSKPERNYAQVEREALAIIFGLKRFEQYLFGRKFQIVTDHKPLITLFGPHTATPALAAARIQRWAVLLSAFNYEIKYRKGSEHINVDTLSRLPASDELQIEGSVYKLSHIEEIPLSSREISSETAKDRVLARVVNYVKWGWEKDIPEELDVYFRKREQLSIQHDCLVWGMRVVIPEKFRKSLLDLIHDTHPGIVRMKAIARMHMWWPALDQDIESISVSCHSCIQRAHMPCASPLQPWVWPKEPWVRIHLDFAQKGNNFFMLIVDAHSKWMEVEHMTQITSSKTIESLRRIFARYGIPAQLVSDNGPQLTSSEFVNFLEANGIKHILIPAYHPQSNGAAERAVQYFKDSLGKMCDDLEDNTSLNHKICRFLLMQHTTPHATTGKAPSELFMGKVLKTKLSFVHTEVSTQIVEKQKSQKKYYDRAHSSSRVFNTGQEVYYRNYSQNGARWAYGVLNDKKGTNTWSIETEHGTKLLHIDQIKPVLKNNENVLPYLKNYDKSNDEGRLKQVEIAPRNIEGGQTTSFKEQVDTKIISDEILNVTPEVNYRSGNSDKDCTRDENSQVEMASRETLSTLRRSKRTIKETVKLNL